jgi:hypothetical protein
VETRKEQNRNFCEKKNVHHRRLEDAARTGQ